MSKISECLFNVEFIDSLDNSFATEYTSGRKASKIVLLFPFAIINLTIRWE